MIYIVVQNQVFLDLALEFKLLLSRRWTGVILLNTEKQIADIKQPDSHLFICFGAHSYTLPMPLYYVIIQLEQSVNSPWFNDSYLNKLQKATAVLDYSYVNYEKLKHLNPNYFCFTCGYLQTTADQWKSLQSDGLINDIPVEYDVSFLGQINTRRQTIINQIRKAGFTVQIIDNLWDDDRIMALKKSKVVINLHFYERSLLETVRLSYLLSLGLHVVSEKSEDRVADTQYGRFLDLVDDVSDYLKNQPPVTKTANFSLFQTSLPDQFEKLCQSSPLLQIIETLASDEIRTELQQIPKMITSNRDILAAETIEANGQLVLKLQPFDISQYPPLSLVTITYNRAKLFPLPIRNLLAQTYPLSLIEWIIIDDSTQDDGDLEGMLNCLPPQLRIKYVKYRLTNQSGVDTPGVDTSSVAIHPQLEVIARTAKQLPLSIGQKRNLGCQLTSHELIAFFDDDDYYYPVSLYSRMATLLSYPTADLVGVGNLDVYDVESYHSAQFHSPTLSEASMMFRKSFWEELPFPDSYQDGEGEGYWFTQSRRDKLIQMPSCFNLIALTSHLNYTGKRRQCLQEQSKLAPFDLLDLETKLFLWRIFKKTYPTRS